MMLTVDELREVFSYDPERGALYWKVDSGARARAGMRAGTLGIGKTLRYQLVKYEGQQYYTHKVIWALHHGLWASGEVDHIDGDRTNNSVTNLREVTHAENTRNARRRSDNRSGINGVCWEEKKNRWRVQIGKNGRIHQVGRYRDFFEACCSRKSTEQHLGYHANHGRAK
jgi:hypothetical protein